MRIFEQLCEQRIAEAQRRGDFDQLPGAGAPLDLDEPPLVPPEVRMANRILKNAGVVPSEVELRREIGELHRRLAADGEAADAASRQRLLALMTRLSLARGQLVDLTLDNYYWERLKQRAA